MSEFTIKDLEPGLYALLGATEDEVESLCKTADKRIVGSGVVPGAVTVVYPVRDLSWLLDDLDNLESPVVLCAASMVQLKSYPGVFTHLPLDNIIEYKGVYVRD